MVFKVWVILLVGTFLPKDNKAAPSRFSCSGLPEGLYADVTTNCQKYFVCGVKGPISTHSCPNGTKFRQDTQICDHSNLVKCSMDLSDNNRSLVNSTPPSIEKVDKPEETTANHFATIHLQRNGKSTFNKLLTILDTRSLFFIPENEFADGAISSQNISIDIDPKMKFRRLNTNNNYLANEEVQCPKHCHRILMNPATCKPCVHIK